MLPACFLKQSSICVFQNPWVVRPAGIHSGTAMSRGLYHPATIFMGRHMSAAWNMQQKASHAAESHSVPEPCSHRQAALSSDETGRCFPRVGSDMPCTNKPDKQDAKADALVREKMPITSGVVLAESSMRGSLTILTEHRNPAEYRLLSPSRGSVESRTADLNSDTSVEEEEVTREHLVASAEDTQPVPVAFVPEPSISEEDQESIPGMMVPLLNSVGAHVSQTDAPGCCFFFPTPLVFCLKYTVTLTFFFFLLTVFPPRPFITGSLGAEATQFFTFQLGYSDTRQLYASTLLCSPLLAEWLLIILRSIPQGFGFFLLFTVSRQKAGGG